MSYYPRVKKAVGASEKIFEYVDRKPDVSPEGSLAPKTLRGHVRFNNVAFAYPTRPDENVLKVSTETLLYEDIHLHLNIHLHLFVWLKALAFITEGT